MSEPTQLPPLNRIEFRIQRERYGWRAAAAGPGIYRTILLENDNFHGALEALRRLYFGYTEDLEEERFYLWDEEPTA